MEISTENYFLLKDKKLLRADIAREFEITENQLKKLITKNGWAKKIPTISNKFAFDSFDELSCYWAGFIASDGNVDLKSRVRIMLNYDDTSHLEKFKEYLNSTHAISSNTEKYYRSSFELTSIELCNGLKNNFNIVPNKTSILKYPDKLPLHLMKHFIRGYFDGDGSICESFSNKNSITATLYATFACGSREFITWLFKYLQTTLGLSGYLQKFSDTKFQIKYSTNDAKILLNWMYRDSTVYLDRKYSLFNKIVLNNDRKIR